MNVSIRCPIFSLTQFVVEKLLLAWHDHSIDAPELWLGLAGDSREIKVDTKARGLPWRVLLQEFKHIHVQVRGRAQSLVHLRLHDKPYVRQIRMTLEHVDRCLHSTLHRGN